MLLTPGYITDLTGFLLLVPPLRRVVIGFIRRWLRKRLADGRIVFTYRK